MSHLLPLPWVESLFAQLAVKYGRAFLSQYEGVKLPLVKDDWARELGGFFQQTGADQYDAPAITWALDNLVPGKPPTALEFRAICRRYDPPALARLDYEPKRGVDPRYRDALQKLGEPLDDPRPEKVRAAYRFVSMWGTPGVRLSPMKAEWLAFSRKVVADWERGLEKQPEASHAQ